MDSRFVFFKEKLIEIEKYPIHMGSRFMALKKIEKIQLLHKMPINFKVPYMVEEEMTNIEENVQSQVILGTFKWYC